MEKETYYKQIVNLVNVAIVKFTKDLIITDYSGNSEHVFGYTKEEVLGKSIEGTVFPEVDSSGEPLVDMINRQVQNANSFEYYINENLTKTGERLWMQWYITEVQEDAGKPPEIISIGIDVTERINAERALKESENSFKVLSNMTLEGILVHDNGIIVDCNLTIERRSGYDKEELVGKNLVELLIADKYKDVILEKMMGGDALYEIEIIHKSGKLIPVSIESRRIKVDGSYIRVAVIRDISTLNRTIAELDEYKIQLEDTVQKRTAELSEKSIELEKQNSELQFERNQLRTIIDNIPGLIYIKDKNGKFLNANLKLVKHISQDNLEQVIGKTDRNFFAAKYAEKYQKDEEYIIRTGDSIIEEEEICVQPSGEEMILSTTKVPLYDENKKIVGIVGIGWDVTEKKLAEERLKKQAEELKVTNIELEERAQKIETLNKELSVAISQLSFANAELNEQKEELETTLEQLKEAQDRIVQSEKMASLGVLMAGIAHEINNPVNFVYAGVNSISRDFDDVKKVIDGIEELHSKIGENSTIINEINSLKAEYEIETALSAIDETVEDIRLGANRISEIVAGLGRFTRLETEEWLRTDLHEEIDNALILLRNKYKNHVTVEKEYNVELPRVECRPGRINQVFLNIINNAIDAIENKQGKIFIKTDCSKDWAIVSIKDSGKGMKPQEQSKIFDPFFTTKEVGKGMGLGLSITYSIVQEHRGDIEIVSEEGKGTEFILKFPLSQKFNAE